MKKCLSRITLSARIIVYLTIVYAFLPGAIQQTQAQVTNWIGGISSDYFNKDNWSDNTINFTTMNARTLIIGPGSPNNCVHTGGNSSNVNYRPGVLNTLAGGTFTVKGALYPNNSDNLNGTIIVNAPADFNIRNNVFIGRNASAVLNVTGGKISSRLGFNLANGSAGSSADVTLSGGSLNAGTDLNIANGTGLTASLKITGGAVNVPNNLNIGAGGSVFISGIGLIKMNGDKRTQLNNHLANGKITCPVGKTLAVTYDGSATTIAIPQNTNSLITEFPEYVLLKNEFVEAKIDKNTSNITSLKVNGVETVNTIGSSRTGTYYDFTTSKGFETIFGATFSIKRDEPDFVDISFKRPYTPGVNVTPCDADIHYVLKKGDKGIYTYSILEHKAEYPTFDMGSWRQVMWIAPDSKNTSKYLCERIYVDSLRNWEMPSLYDFSQASPTGIAEIVKLNTGVRAGKYDGKYEYCSPSFWETLTYGHASNVNKIGSWFVYGSPEFFNEGPTYHDLNAAAGIIHSCMNTVHYNAQGMVVNAGEYWTKIYGPYLIYTSTEATGDANWADAKARAQKEKAEWPYSWLTNTPQYPLADQRGSVSGKFIINDPLKPNIKGANAWVGVTILSNPANQWQMEEKNYQYWVRTDANGNFSIPNVRPGTYSFFAFSDGATGEYSQANVTVTAGVETNLGDVTWNIARDKGSLVWEIGVPNRTTDEYKFGHYEYMEGFVYNKFKDTFSNIIEYKVEDKNWAEVLPYAHSSYIGANNALSQWKWRINFNLPANTPLTGNARLTIAYAGADHAQTWIYVNNESKTFTTYFPENGGGNALLRQANYAKYSVKKIDIPMSRLKIGANVITLLMPSTSSIVNHVMYDYLSLEANIPTKTQAINFPAIETKTIGDADFEAEATTTSGLPLSYFTADTSVAEVVDGKIKIKRVGSALIKAYQPGDAEYLPSDTLSQILTVVHKPQSITFEPLPEKTFGEPDFELAAISTSGLPVSFTSSDTTVATVENGIVHITGIGTTIINASQVGDLIYGRADSIDRVLVVVADTIEPTVPGSLSATVTDSTANLNWISSSDNIEVKGYRIFKDGILIATLGESSTAYFASGLVAAKTYIFSVAAFDNAGNISAEAILSVLTPDTQAPSAPASLTDNKTNKHKVELSWLPSVDNVAVTGYLIFRNADQLNSSAIMETSYLAERPIGNDIYEFVIKAIDAAGNISAESNIVRIQNGHAGDKAKSDIATGEFLENQTMLNEGLLVYPNPSNGNFKISLNSRDDGKLNISIFNALGVLLSCVNDIKSGVYQKELQLVGLASGTYYVRVTVNKTSITKTILIK